MFVQVIRGAVESEPDAMRMLERWLEEVRPDAIGWLGMTAGVTPEGELIALVRFTSAEDAQRNSERAEQGAWWAEMEKAFTGSVDFHDCDEVELVLDGARDDAGFVQVMEWPDAGSQDVAEMAELATRYASEYRPDVIGGLVAVARDGTVFESVAFTSEAEARRGEAGTPPEDLEEMERVMGRLGEPIYHDLPSPLLAS